MDGWMVGGLLLLAVRPSHSCISFLPIFPLCMRACVAALPISIRSQLNLAWPRAHDIRSQTLVLQAMRITPLCTNCCSCVR